MSKRTAEGKHQFLATAAAAVTLGATAMWFYYQRRIRHQRRNTSTEEGISDKADEKKKMIPEDLVSSPYVDELRLAISLALDAGKNIYMYYDSKGTMRIQDGQGETMVDLTRSTKSDPVDFCTEIDVQNEQWITKGIRERFPSHKIIGEESTGTGTIPPLTNDPTWIIDPIDGTTNFVCGLHLSCVSIGYCIDQCPVMGVIYAPNTNELYIAVKGYGAYRNGIRLCALNRTSSASSSLSSASTSTSTPIPSTPPPAPLSLSNALVVCEWGYERSAPHIRKQLAIIEKILHHGCLGTRQFGSGVLDLCYVATGRIGVVYAGVTGNDGWKPWDYAAGLVLVEEVGGVMESIERKPPSMTSLKTKQSSFDLYSKSIICAANETLLEEVRTIILSESS